MFKTPQWLGKLNRVDRRGIDSTSHNPIVPAHQYRGAWAPCQVRRKAKLNSVAVPSWGRRPVEGIISEYTIPPHSQMWGDPEEQGKLPLPDGVRMALHLFSTPVKTGEANRLPLTQVPRAAFFFFFFSPSHLLLVLFNFLQAFLSSSLISLYPSEPSQ